MAEPIALLHLDSRSHGPAQCNICDEDVEEVLLTRSARLICPSCGGDVEGLEGITDLFTSARILTAVEVKAFQETEHCCDDYCRSYGCSRRRGRDGGRTNVPSTPDSAG